MRNHSGNIYIFVNNKFEPLPFVDGWMDCAKFDLLAACTLGIGELERCGATFLRENVDTYIGIILWRKISVNDGYRRKIAWYDI